MKKLITLLVALTCCTTAFAESQRYVCERPALDGKKGCGSNNTYATYSFLVDTRDFDAEKPEYIFQGGEGCNFSEKAKYRYLYLISPETIIFKLAKNPLIPRDKMWTTVTVDRQSMKATMDKVNHSPELTCRIEKVTEQ